MRPLGTVLVVLLSMVAGGCLNDTDNYFTVMLRNDLDDPIHVDGCNALGAEDCSVNEGSQADIDPGDEKPFVVVGGSAGTLKLSDDGGALLGCIPWAFEEMLEDDGTVFNASQVVDCDQMEPVDPVATAKPWSP